MSKIVIEGGKRLCGTIPVQGAKNAVLPILAGCVLCDGHCVIHNCPRLKDVEASINILKCLGFETSWENNTVMVDASRASGYFIPEHLMREMRSSIIFLGAIIAKRKQAVAYYPGGCELGPRPIDLHLKAFRQMGVNIAESHGFINCSAENLQGASIHLDFPSVGATENIMLLANRASGVTTISNAAKEPEITDLAEFLNSMGAKITGAGTDIITIEGVKEMHGTSYSVMPDRIVAATYLAAAAITKGEVTLKSVVPEHVGAVLSVLRDCGSEISTASNRITLCQPGTIKPADLIRTMPYPGFPTDAQAQMMALLTVANGTSIITETIFENRFKHAGELCRMGADIKLDGRVAVVKGVKHLQGATVNAMDLRGGAALVVAGLAAEGTTEIGCLSHIDRGYERLEENLRNLGAAIKRVE